MPFPLLPVIIVCLGGVAYHQKGKRDRQTAPLGVLTAERQAIFEDAINDLKDAEKLRELAKSFRDQGLPAHADMLEKRAKLRELPPEVKKVRKEVFYRALRSTNASAVHGIANAYEKEGATGAAAALRKYAASIPIVTQEPAVTVAVQPVQPEPRHEAPAESVEATAEFTEEETLPSDPSGTSEVNQE